MAHFVRTRGFAGGLMLLLCGMMSASTAAGGAHARAILLTLPVAADTPLVIALADPLSIRVEPAAARADEPPVFTEDDGAAITTRTAPAVSPPAPASTAYAPARFFTINQVLAKRNIRVDATPTVKLAAIDPATTATDASPLPDSNYGGEPFGLFTFRAPEGLLWTKWRKVQSDIRAEAPILAQCQSQPDHCTPAAARFNSVVAEAKSLSGRARIDLVNERINDAIHYTSDMTQFGVPDVWSAPLASLTTGLGDCEDYAIAKYVVLRDAGVADADLHLLLVRDNAVRMDHAVLAVRDDGHWLILDNRWTRPSEDAELKQFSPLFALDEQGVQLFAAPYAALKYPAGGKSALTAGSEQGVVLTETELPTQADIREPWWIAAPVLL